MTIHLLSDTDRATLLRDTLTPSRAYVSLADRARLESRQICDESPRLRRYLAARRQNRYGGTPPDTDRA